MLPVTASQAGSSSAVGHVPTRTLKNGPQVTKARHRLDLGRFYLVARQNHPSNVVITSITRGFGASTSSSAGVQGVWLSVPVP